ncbi:hypothetical protein DFA_00507 [Cavenderia fasciculata]|uniref:Transmembrane protein n=1 Tax=Cavenderia fasciculata TaxID=261658 RepID=F4PSA0_CACFS|nr:uncharacterized protein DFA_00507 [Cavenderia fasciculata]EGG20646.1 hypothetical protein DFA_00507 [Cavenderia fasciculata]|eukprot:XP_004358496.1 hypothetical protein DFA_00507 [Cavenderia fasciculata]
MKRNQTKDKTKQQETKPSNKTAQPITSDEETDDTLVIDQSVTKKKEQNGVKSNDQKQQNGETNTSTTTTATATSAAASTSVDTSVDTKKSTNKYKTVIKFTLLFLMVPLLFSMPLILRSAGEAVANNREYLYYIWALYAVIWAALIYNKRKTTSISSFVNHNLQWLIAALGAFIVLDIPKMIQQVDLRREVLFVWCTLTWIPNIILYYFDDTNYYDKEAKEEERSQRKKKKDEEKRAKLEEKRRRRQQERMDRYTPNQRMLLNASIYFGIALLVALLAWQTYRWYLKTQQNIEERIRLTPGHVEPEPEFHFDD